jgi:predicted RecA/RadA family phage recombinase
MGATFRFNGDEIPYTPSGADVSAGDVIVAGEFVAVAKNDIADGVEGVLSVAGIYEVNVLATVDFTAGQIVYWDVSEGEATDVDDTGTNKQMGIATAANASTGANVFVRLER